jgi:hypothetical protein
MNYSSTITDPKLFEQYVLQALESQDTFQFTELINHPLANVQFYFESSNSLAKLNSY